MSKRVTIRLPDDDAAMLEKSAEFMGTNTSETIRLALRYLCLDEQPKVEVVERIDEQPFRKAVGDLNKVGNNLNQITRLAHVQNVDAVAEDIEPVLREVRGAAGELNLIAKSIVRERDFGRYRWLA